MPETSIERKAELVLDEIVASLEDSTNTDMFSSFPVPLEKVQAELSAYTNDQKRLVAELFHLQGSLLQYKDKYVKGIKALTASIELASEKGVGGADPESYFVRGKCYQYSDETELAIQDYTTSIEMQPRQDSAYMHRGHIYASEGRHAEAIEDYTTALRYCPSYQVSGVVFLK